MNYASTYMGSWEKELLEKSAKKPLAYFRFVDDVWGLWTHGLDALEEFHQLSNTLHPRIKIELRHATENIDFPYVITIIRNGHLVTSTSSQNSSHPESTKKATAWVWGLYKCIGIAVWRDRGLRLHFINIFLSINFLFGFYLIVFSLLIGTKVQELCCDARV